MNDFVHIPAGTFMMGSPQDEPGRNLDERLHTVNITQPFEMLTTPVTQGWWERVMKQNPSAVKQVNFPVTNVSWNDTQRFIQHLNSNRNNSHYRLPTEAEWEYACRAGTTSARYGDLDDIAWYIDNSVNKLHTVGQKQPNAWGLYDMLGNVREWCSDWYGDYINRNVTDPQGSLGGSTRVNRGGSWFSDALYVRAAYRGYHPSVSCEDFIGFRLVREIRDKVKFPMPGDKWVTSDNQIVVLDLTSAVSEYVQKQVQAGFFIGYALPELSSL